MNKSTQRTLKGTLLVPGDKSISHRALIFSTLTEGTCEIVGFSPAQDCVDTIRCLQCLGLQVRTEGTKASIKAKGISGLQEPCDLLYAGNSGTTIRLLSGLLAGTAFSSVLDGDASLRERPMSRVLSLLAEMGAQVTYQRREGYPPFSIKGNKLRGGTFFLPVASAQVQTAVLLAGLQASGNTSVVVPTPVRDHTARLFKHMGVPFSSPGSETLIVAPLTSPLAAFNIEVPGDISSAAYFMVAAACLPGSEVTLTNVGINPGRSLILKVLQAMGAEIDIEYQGNMGFEPVANLTVKYAKRLVGTEISAHEIAKGIDEIPILALAGALCDGTFSVKGASELRVKESDRLSAMINNLRCAGALVNERPDGLVIEGKMCLPGASSWQTYADHRLAMTGLIASILCYEPVVLDDVACIGVSYPGFQEHLNCLLSTG